MDIPSDCENNWWQTQELIPPDPWAYIVSDFQWSMEIITKLESYGYTHTNKAIGHFPESDGKSTDNLDFAANTLINTHDRVLNKIEKKLCDPEFLWLWGEYQKAIALIKVSWPEFKRTIEAQLSGKERSKEKARQWYALWYEWYLEDHPKSRHKFDKYFEKIVIQILKGEKEIIDKDEIDDVYDIVEMYFDDPKEECPTLALSFRYNKFNSHDFKIALEEAKANRSSFPKVGEEHYR